jgi:phenylpropionate dioxygenase-like ring-hydroxylating dioxygenase large terminal subunit
MSNINWRTLTQIGASTPMGALMRSYWQPVLLSSELPDRDGPPVRVRLLGENLIAFRDSSGGVGLLGNHCPHRGASLFFGRNEQNGLRCVYHGWKFDRSGRCVDMPNESPETDFKDRIRHTAYPCEERGGIIWAYMGPTDKAAPPQPDFEWLRVPDSHRYITKHTQDCNWLQALEGDMDSSHVGFLHSTLNRRVPGIQTADDGPAREYLAKSLQPHFEVMPTEFGLMIGASRRVAEDKDYWRVTVYVMPFYALIPPTGDAPLRVNIWHPMDDENTLVWRIDYHPARPLTDAELANFRSGQFAHVSPAEYQPPTTAAAGHWRPLADKSNDYLVDRTAQRQTSFSGLKGFWLQDRVVTESMGPIYDRSRENLRSSDAGVVQLRRLLIRSVEAIQNEGMAPPALEASCHRARAVSMELPRSASWKEFVREPAMAQGSWRISP